MPPTRTISIIMTSSLLALLSVGPACGQQTQPEPDPSPEIPPSRSQEPGVVDPIPGEEVELVQMIEEVSDLTSVDQLLEALETADADLETFAAEVKWDRRFRLQGDRHVRFGELFFRVAPSAEGEAPHRTFAVRFDELLIDDVLRQEQSQWVFDGQWLYEKDFKEKTFVARRLAREGERIDPLRLGEGPIPLPIGQKKEDILARYEAELLAPGAGLESDSSMEDEEIAELESLASFVSDAHQLRLTPRELYRDESEFREIRLWYQRKTLRPRMAMTVNRSGDDSIVQLINIRTNQPLPEGSIEIEQPREADGWRVEIDPGRFDVNNDG